MSSDISALIENCGMVCHMAFAVYRGCKSSSEDLQKMASDISDFYMVLKDIQDDLIADSTGLSDIDADCLKEKLTTAYTDLISFDIEIRTYDKLSTTMQKKFDMVKFGMEDIGEANLRIRDTTTSLRCVEQNLNLFSHTALEAKVLKYLGEVARGDHAKSVLNMISGDEISKQERWKQFQEELEELGFSRIIIRENKEFINAIVRRARQSGVIDLATSIEGGEPLGDVDDDDAASTLSRVSTRVDELFDERKLNINTPRRPRGRDVDSKKAPPLIALGLRALRIVSDERLIEAADEGKPPEEVENMIRRGANVHASDKWYWTALHMAAYGGFDDIAAKLIEEGAKLDVKTVDGETPLMLAERQRHVRVVRVIMEEMRRRELEQANSVPVSNADNGKSIS